MVALKVNAPWPGIRLLCTLPDRKLKAQWKLNGWVTGTDNQKVIAVWKFNLKCYPAATWTWSLFWQIWCKAECHTRMMMSILIQDSGIWRGGFAREWTWCNICEVDEFTWNTGWDLENHWLSYARKGNERAVATRMRFRHSYNFSSTRNIFCRWFLNVQEQPITERDSFNSDIRHYCEHNQAQNGPSRVGVYESWSGVSCVSDTTFDNYCGAHILF